MKPALIDTDILSMYFRGKEQVEANVLIRWRCMARRDVTSTTRREVTKGRTVGKSGGPWEPGQYIAGLGPEGRQPGRPGPVASWRRRARHALEIMRRPSLHVDYYPL